MPPKSSANLGYESHDEYKRYRGELRGLLESKKINLSEFQGLLDAPKADVDAFINEQMFGAGRKAGFVEPPPVIAPITTAQPAPPTPTPVAPTPSSVEIVEIDGMPVEEFLRKQAEKRAQLAGVPRSLPPEFVPPAAVGEAVGEAAKREAERRGIGTPIGPVVEEMKEELAPIVEVPRGPSGAPRPYPVEPAKVGEVGGVLDALRPQEIMFPEDRQALEKSGILGTALSKLISRESTEGAIVESYPAYIGRLLGVVPEVLIGGVEAALTEKTLQETVPKRIREGRGFMGGAYDLGEALVDAAGIEDENLRQLIPMRFGALGLGLDLLYPLDSGLTSVAKKVGQTRVAGKAVGEMVEGVAKEALKEAIPSVVRAELGESIAKNASARFSTNEDNIDQTASILYDVAKGQGVAVPGSRTASARSLGLLDPANPRKLDPELLSTAYLDVSAKLQKGIDEARAAGNADLVKKLEDQKEALDVFTYDVGDKNVRAVLPEPRMIRKEKPPTITELEEGAIVEPVAPVTERMKFVDVDSEALGAATTSLSESLLKYSALKQYTELNKVFAGSKGAVNFGTFTLPRSEISAINSKVKELLSGIDAKGSLSKTGFVEVPRESLVRIKRHINQLKTGELRIPQKTDQLEEISKLLDPTGMKKPSKTTKLDARRWNELVIGLTYELARRNPLATVVEEGLTTTARKAKTAAQAADVRELIQPSETRIGKAFRDAKEKIFPSELKGEELLTPADRAIVKESKAKLATIPDVFKKDVLAGMKKDGLDRASAFAKALYDGYKNRAGFIAKEGKFVDIRGLQEDKATADFAEEMFKDFLNTIYGGEERVVETRRLITGEETPGLKTSDYDSFFTSVINPTGSMPDNVFSVARNQFVRQIEEGDWSAALGTLAKLHKGLQGKKLGDLAEFGATVEKLTDVKPVIGSDDFIPALSYAYMNRKARDVIEETIQKTTPVAIKKFQQQGKIALADFARKVSGSLMDLPEGVAGKLGYEGLSTNTTIRDTIAKLLKDPKLFKGLADPKFELGKLTDIPEAQAALETINSEINRIIKEVDPKAVGNLVQQEARKETIRIVLNDFLQQAESDMRKYSKGSKREYFFKTELTPEEIKQLTEVYGTSANIQKNVFDAIASGITPGKVTTSKELKRVITSTESGRIIYNQLQNARQFAQVARTIDAIKAIPKTDLVPEVIDAFKSAQVSDILAAINDTKLEPSQRTLNLLRRLLDTPVKKTLGDAWTGTSSLAKSGMLAGAYVPNFAYHATNILSAPFIMLSTLGPRKAITGLSRFFDPSVNATVGELFSFAPTVKKNIPVVKTPDGRVYDPASIAQIIAENNIMQTKEALSFTPDIIKDFVKWSGRNLRGEEIGIARRMAREFDPTKPNIWYEVANYFDTRFRTGVFVDALKSGKTEGEAVQLARDALFDYSKMSDFERETIGSILWFWSFERAALTQTFKNLVKNPKRFFIEHKLKQSLDEDGKVHSGITEYSENRPFLALLKSTKGNFEVYGPPMPQADAIAKTIDYITPLMPLLYGDLSKGLTGEFKTGVDRISSSLASVIAATGGYQLDRGEISDPSNYVDPRIMNWIKMSPVTEDVFKTMVNLEPIPPSELTPTMQTFDGLAYRIPFNDKWSKINYNLILAAAKTAGMERMLRDYGTILTGEQEGEQVPLSVEAPTYSLELLRDLGIIKIEPGKTGEQIRSEVRKGVVREIGEQ